MAEINDLPWIDAQKLKELLFGLVILFLIVMGLYSFFGFIDKPKYIGNEYGYVTGCTQALTKHGHSGAIFCGARFENGNSATFQSDSYLTVNKLLVFRHFKGTITGRDSYTL